MLNINTPNPATATIALNNVLWFGNGIKYLAVAAIPVVAIKNQNNSDDFNNPYSKRKNATNAIIGNKPQTKEIAYKKFYSFYP